MCNRKFYIYISLSALYHSLLEVESPCKAGIHSGNISIMSAPKLPTRRPNTGSQLRLPTKTKRSHFLETDVTPQEHKAILDYCEEHKISVSQLLAELVLRDAAERESRTEPRFVKIDLKLTSEQFEKLELLAHVRKKESVEDLIQDLIQPHLDMQRLHAPDQTRFLRFYLSDQEHARALRYIADRGVPARKYVSFIAIKKINKERRGRK